MNGFGATRLGSVASRSLGIPAAAYPGRVAGNSDLIVAVDQQQTTLLAPLGLSDTTMTVSNASMIGAYNLQSIDSEIVKTTGPPAGNVIPIQRGFDGTAAASHVSGAVVSGLIDAYHHNCLAAEIEAIETALGPNLANVPGIASSPFVSNAMGNFPAQTPGGSLIVGANVITLSPVPLGVNGTDTSHYLYVSGGTGTPEAVQIVGGTAVSGAASGTLIIQCANTHSGAWTIQTATAGMQEAAVKAGAGGHVIVNQAGTVYAPTTLSVSAIVEGSRGATITASGSPSSIFTIAADNVTIRNVSIVAGTAQYAITNSGTHTGIIVAENKITGSATGAIAFTAGTDLVIRDNTVTNFTNAGINCLTSVSISRVRIYGNYVSSVGSTTHNGGAIACWGSHTYVDDNIIVIGGNYDGGIVILNNDGVGCFDIAIRNNLIEVAGTTPFEPIGVGSVTDFVVSGNVCVASVAATVGYIGIEINLSKNGVVANNVVDLKTPSAVANGIYVESSSYVDIIGNTVSNWGTQNTGKGISLLQTNASGATSNSISSCLVASNVVTPSAGFLGQCIGFDTLTTGNCVGNQIANNIINGTASSIGIQVANSSGATVSGMVISNNTINNCATGVVSSAVSGSKVFGNILTGVATAYTFAGAPLVFIHDLMTGILFANLPANMANGSMLYVADSTIANPAAAGGTGAIVKRLNGINVGN